MKNLLFVTVMLIMTATSQAQAQVRPEPRPMDPVEQKVRELDRRMNHLEENYRRLEYRLSILEQGSYPNPYPPVPEPRIDYSCLLVDTGYTKTFLGRGPTQLQAETNARLECGKSVHSSYCASTVRCSNGIREPGYRGYFCTLQDTGYSKTFSGEGIDLIEAEAKAKISCQQSVHSSYCGNARVKCEGIRQ